MRNSKKQGSRGKIAWSPVMWEVSLGVNVNYSIFLPVRDGTRTVCIKVLRKSYPPTLTVVFNALENDVSRLQTPSTASSLSFAVPHWMCTPAGEGAVIVGADQRLFKTFSNTWQSHSWWWPNSFASLCSSCANGRREKCELCRSLRPEVTAGK